MEVLKQQPCISNADTDLKNKYNDNTFLFLFYYYFFFIRVFFHGHWQLTGQQGKGGNHFFPLYHFHPLTNIQTFICNFARQVTFATLHVKVTFLSKLIPTEQNYHALWNITKRSYQDLDKITVLEKYSIRITM